MQNFYIKQNSTMPHLALELVQNGMVDYQIYNERIQNAKASLTLTKSDDCSQVVFCRPMEIVENLCISNTGVSNATKFYLLYRFKKSDTKRKASYNAEITIEFLDTGDVMKLPIYDKIRVNVI